MSDSNSYQETCPLCQKEIGGEASVVIRETGAASINSVSVQRKDNISVTAGTTVHVRCRKIYVNPVYIQKCLKKRQEATPCEATKRISRSISGRYDSQTDCIFCNCKVVKENPKGNHPRERMSYKGQYACESNVDFLHISTWMV